MRRTAALALAAIVLAAGCGGGGGGGDSAGDLVWVEQPRLLEHPTLPDDRVLTGRVRNDSLRRLELESSAIEVLDARGEPIAARAIFLEGYVKPLESRNRPSQETDAERRRRGVEVVLEAGASAPLTVSWREASDRRASRIDYGAGSLPLP